MIKVSPTYVMNKINVNFITEGAKYQLENLVHSLPQFRINGPLQNMREFAEDFNCPRGSPMNPKSKCEIW
jgi:neprilysin